jgi:hypothetical protein
LKSQKHKKHFISLVKKHLYKPTSVAIGISLLLVFQLSSCNNDELSYPIQQTIAIVEKDSNTISEDDWAKYDQEIEEIQQRIKNKRDEFTPQELEKVNKLIGKYYALKASKKLDKLKQELKDASQQLEGAYETIFKKKDENTK